MQTKFLTGDFIYNSTTGTYVHSIMSRDERQHVIIFLRRLKYRYKGSPRSRFVPRDYRVIRRKDERDCFIRRELTVRKYPTAAAKTVLESARSHTFSLLFRVIHLYCVCALRTRVIINL